MKAKRRILTAATLSAFLSLAGVTFAHAKANIGEPSATPTSGKKGHRRPRHGRSFQSHKGGKKNLRKRGGTTPPPK